MLPEAAAVRFVEFLLAQHGLVSDAGYQGALMTEGYAPFGGPAFSPQEWLVYMSGISQPTFPHYLAALRAWKLSCPLGDDLSVAGIQAEAANWATDIWRQQRSFQETIDNQPFEEELARDLLELIRVMQPSVNELWTFYGWLGAVRRRRRRAR